MRAMGGDPAAAQVAADPRDVVALVGVQLDRPAPRVAAAPVPDRRHRIQDRLDQHAVVPVAPKSATLSGSPPASTSRWYLLPRLAHSCSSSGYFLGAAMTLILPLDESLHQTRRGTDAGALTVLPSALTYRAGVAVHAGDFVAAAGMVEEAEAISRSTGNASLRYTSLVLTAWRGDEHQTLDQIRISRNDASLRGEGRALSLADYVTAVLYNGLGRYSEALTAGRRAVEYDDLGLCGWALVELIEAAARTG
jgi:hypothetical protein